MIPAPAGIKPGFYYLVVSHAEDFAAESNNSVNYTDFWVSDLAIVSRHDHGKLEMAGLVTDNRSGEPVAGREGPGLVPEATTPAGRRGRP